VDSDSSSHSNDEDIIQKFRANGDLSLFKVLVQRHQARVYATAYRVLGNSDEAEEVVQDTFIKVHQNLDKFKASASFSSWLFRIAHNVSMDVLRSKQRRRESNLVAFDPQAAPEDDLRTNPGGPVSQLADYRPDPSQMLDIKEQSQVIQDCLNNLPEPQKLVLVMHDLEGLSYQDIADISHTNIGTVRSRLHYGRLKLKELLAPYFPSAQSPKDNKGSRAKISPL